VGHAGLGYSLVKSVFSVIRSNPRQCPNSQYKFRSKIIPAQIFNGLFGLGLFGFGVGLFGVGFRLSVFLPTPTSRRTSGVPSLSERD
jgi:hypothetical protein